MDTTQPATHPTEPQAITPDKECDIVMKGGITSGVVYPAAVLELKENYRFVNVGGAPRGRSLRWSLRPPSTAARPTGVTRASRS
jgi:hypothetical protein